MKFPVQKTLITALAAGSVTLSGLVATGAYAAKNEGSEPPAEEIIDLSSALDELADNGAISTAKPGETVKLANSSKVEVTEANKAEANAILEKIENGTLNADVKADKQQSPAKETPIAANPAAEKKQENAAEKDSEKLLANTGAENGIILAAAAAGLLAAGTATVVVARRRASNNS